MWTNHEERKLVELYPHAPREDIVQALPRKQWRSIIDRACRLGVRRESYWQQPSTHAIISKLIERRKQLGFNQSEIAATCRISRAHFNKMEGGHVFPSLLQLERWCAALRMNVTVSDNVEMN